MSEPGTAAPLLAVRAAARALTFAEALNALNDCVAERGPNYVYPYSDRAQYTRPKNTEWTSQTGGCLNVTRTSDGSPGKPACIIGCALAKLGVPLDYLSWHTAEGSYDLLSSLRDEGWSIGEVALLFGDVQGLQDSGTPWGDAVVIALNGGLPVAR